MGLLLVRGTFHGLITKSNQENLTVLDSLCDLLRFYLVLGLLLDIANICFTPRMYSFLFYMASLSGKSLFLMSANQSVIYNCLLYTAIWDLLMSGCIKQGQPCVCVCVCVCVCTCLWMCMCML